MIARTFVSLLLICGMYSYANADQEMHYKDMKFSELKQKAQSGDKHAQSWMGRRSRRDEDKVFWYEKAAEHDRSGLDASAVAYLYHGRTSIHDEKKAYFWFSITDARCQAADFHEKWCADAREKKVALERDLLTDEKNAIQSHTSEWLKKHQKE